ncbi:MAG: GAF domain-containing sensor histidine kinase [Sphingobacteriaceae bacterium]|nr:MAG: GAF domain-containing sensor histidine kinase [Sphingobacteriaceae bacterium]
MLIPPVMINEAERLEALQSYNIFDTAEEKDFDALTALASAICKVPIALITFIDEKRQHFKSHHGTDFTENMRDLSFCTHAIASGDDIMIVPDASLDERFADNPMVTGPTQVAFYAGVPLVNEDGYALGTICIIDQQVHTLEPEQTEALKTLAQQVVDKLELRRKVMRLEKTNQELLNSNVIIQKFATMAAHDIKNPLSSILLTSQALRQRHEKMQDSSCLRLVDLNITSAKNLLGLVDEMLAYSKSPELLLAKKQQISINALLHKVISLLNVPDNVDILLPDESSVIYFSGIALEQIMINLLSNAIRYNDKEEGVITIRFKQSDGFYQFEVEDNGVGIAEQYHEKIFASNFTLKNTDRFNEKGSGIGLSTVKDLVSVLGGDISVKSETGKGSIFYMNFKK